MRKNLFSFARNVWSIVYIAITQLEVQQQIPKSVNHNYVSGREKDILRQRDQIIVLLYTRGEINNTEEEKIEWKLMTSQDADSIFGTN
jgi:hypothetical protein